MDRLAIKGKARVRVWRGGKVLSDQTHKNLVMALGKELITDILQQTGTDRPSHIAIGSGLDTVLDSQTALQGAEHDRQGTGVPTKVGNTLTYTATFTAAGSITMNEAGIFNAAAAGVMLARFLTQSVDLFLDDIIVVDWTLTIG